jgi:hypothetical protein
VFYADGTGTVRSLSAAGQVEIITTFSTSSQQILSYAVSPDGTQLLGAVLNVPPVTSPGTQCTRPGPFYAGDFSLDVFKAQAGATPHLLYRRAVPEGSANYPCLPVQLAGWDRRGPFGIAPACLGPGGGPVQYPGPVARVDAVTGQVLAPIADPASCQIQDIVMSGAYVCPVGPLGSGDVSVRAADGNELWRYKVQPPGGFSFLFLSPDEQHVLAGAQGEVLGRDGTDVNLGANRWFAGWLDSSTAIGYDNIGLNLGYASLKSPTTFIDLGFQGSFVGTVQT